MVCECGETKSEEVAALGHDWQDATCTEPKKCKRCGETSGSALGHTDGVKCERCGKVLFETLTYSGQGDKTITNINIPSGRYVIKGHFSSPVESDFIRAELYDDSGEDIARVDALVHETPIDSEDTFDSSVQNGYIKINTANDGKWTITIDAF